MSRGSECCVVCVFATIDRDVRFVDEGLLFCVTVIAYVLIDVLSMRTVIDFC